MYKVERHIAGWEGVNTSDSFQLLDASFSKRGGGGDS